MDKKTLFFTNEKEFGLQKLYSFYNIDEVVLKYEHQKNFKKYDLNEYKYFFVHNPTINFIESTYNSCKNSVVKIFINNIEKNLYEYIKKYNKYFIFVYDELDKFFLEVNKEKNYALINPIKNIKIEKERVNNTINKYLNTVSCFNDLDEINFDDINLISIFGEHFNFYGVKNITSKENFIKIKTLIKNNVNLISFPVFFLEEALLSSEKLISFSKSFPIDVLYYLLYKEDGCYNYFGTYLTKYVIKNDEENMFYKSKSLFLDFLSKTGDIKNYL